MSLFAIYLYSLCSISIAVAREGSDEAQYLEMLEPSRKKFHAVLLSSLL